MRTKHRILAALICVILLDRVVTTLFWEYEANPFILEIGVSGLWITGLLFLGMFIPVYVWVYETDMKPIAIGLSICLIALYTGVLLTNLLVIMS